MAAVDGETQGGKKLKKMEGRKMGRWMDKN